MKKTIERINCIRSAGSQNEDRMKNARIDIVEVSLRYSNETVAHFYKSWTEEETSKVAKKN